MGWIAPAILIHLINLIGPACVSQFSIGFPIMIHHGVFPLTRSVGAFCIEALRRPINARGNFVEVIVERVYVSIVSGRVAWKDIAEIDDAVDVVFQDAKDVIGPIVRRLRLSESCGKRHGDQNAKRKQSCSHDSLPLMYRNRYAYWL